jgi:L-threonylcarbamoyladenylate synthase
MRLLEESAAAVILAEFVPEIGLGRAINDRLKRAAAQPIH